MDVLLTVISGLMVVLIVLALYELVMMRRLLKEKSKEKVEKVIPAILFHTKIFIIIASICGALLAIELIFDIILDII
ncbi:MAG: hypothetical protein IJ519_02215 [Clostridia bacterium]|nr:hypothetical protein [Clostridia bacterium]